MEQISKGKVVSLTISVMLITLGVAAGTAAASPNITDAVMTFRVFNDDPTSTISFGNNYPSMMFIQDAFGPNASGFANLHIFRLSENGVTPAVFNNNDAFDLSADLMISGTGNGEAGLQISPWWSQQVDGRLNVRSTDGEIAAFGGRMPFYSFTASQGLTYTKGDMISLGVKYRPNSLTMADPGTIEYLVSYNGMDYTSGVIPFDEGNPSEPYGTWGILDDARVGGHLQAFISPSTDIMAEWTNVFYVPEPASVALLALGGLVLIRRR
jgi:hypothetical protein